MRIRYITEILSKEVADLIKKNGRYFVKQNLRAKEFEVFDNIEVKKTGHGFRHLVLKIADLSLIPVKHISRIVNTMYLLYGNDDNGKGKFSEIDIYELKNGDVLWNGRSWLQTERYLQPAMIRYDDKEGLKLLVMNV
jgi:hypothetical protein